MGKIIFSRIDFRLIHGQVVTKWIKQYPATNIVIINDELAADDFMADIYKMAAPSDVGVTISNEEGAQETIDGLNGNVFVLFKNINSALSMAKKGLPFDRLVVGGVPQVEGKKMVTKAVYVDKSDIEKLIEIANHGIDVTFQAIPEDHPLKLADLRQKFN